MMKIVVVGSGLAGYSFAREFRKLNKSASMTLITADDGRFYSKPLLSNALTQGKSADQLATFSAEKMASQLQASIKTTTHVEHIDRENRRVSLATETVAYDKLILAVGAHQLRPPLLGAASNEVLSVNNLLEYSEFRNKIVDHQHVAIIGTGLIGCEFANDLINAGYQVTLIGRAETALDRLVPEEVGRALQTALSEKGVAWHSNVNAERIDKTNGTYRVGLSDGTTLSADILLSATGLAPNLALARDAGLKTEHGIVVNQYLTSSDPNIYALGDCAQVFGQVLPFVMPLMNQARSLAKTLAGENTSLQYPIMPVVVKTPAYPVCAVPPPSRDGDWQITSHESGITALFINKNNLLEGFALAGDDVASKTKYAQMIGSRA